MLTIRNMRLKHPAVEPKGLSGNKRAIWGISIWRDSVVPLAVEFGAFDIDRGHLGVRDDNAFGVLSSVEFTAQGEAGFSGRCRDQLDDHAIADEWLGAPVLADEGKEAVLGFVPLAGAGRQVAGHVVDAAGHSSVRWREIARETVAAEEVRFALDSPLEGDGFDLPVPREMT